MASTCATCGGSGSVAPPGSNCGTCAGVGKVRERRTIEVKVPPGVDDGMRIRLDGKGDAPLNGAGRSGGTPGDLFVRINVQPSKVFTRQGSNLYQTVSVPFYTAILGGRAPVKTLDRDVEVRVPQGTQPGEEMVMRGRGVKKLYRDDYGDLVVKFNVTMPRSLSPAQRRILQQYVQETEAPGSTPFSSGSYTPSSPPPSSGAAASDSTDTASSSSSGSGSSASKSTSSSAPRVDADAPGFTQQARPPPSDTDAGSSKPQWWATMSDDITSTKPAENAAAHEHTIEEKLEEAKEKFEEVAKEEVNNLERDVEAAAAATETATDEPSSAAATEATTETKESEAVKKEKSSEEGDHTLLGDLWKGAKKWFQPK